MDKMMVGCVAGGQSARVPTSHTPGSHLFPLANDVNDYANLLPLCSPPLPRLRVFFLFFQQLFKTAVDDYADFMRYVNSITNVLPTHHATTTTVVIVVALRRRRSKIFLKILLRSGPEHDFFLAFQTEIVNVITNVLLTLNSAVNFLIYCLLGKKFRRIFTDMFCAWMPCYRRRRRASSVDHSDIKLVTNRRTSNLPSRLCDLSVSLSLSLSLSVCVCLSVCLCLPPAVTGGLRWRRPAAVITALVSDAQEQAAVGGPCDRTHQQGAELPQRSVVTHDTSAVAAFVSLPYRRPRLIIIIIIIIIIIDVINVFTFFIQVTFLRF